MEGYVLIHSADIYHHGIKGQKWLNDYHTKFEDEKYRRKYQE